MRLYSAEGVVGTFLSFCRSAFRFHSLCFFFSNRTNREAHQPISEEPVDVCCCCCGVMISSIKLVAIPSSQSIPLQPVEFPTSAGPPGNKFPSAPSYSYSAVPAHPQQFQQPQPQGVNMIYVQQPNQPQGVAIAVPVQQQQGTQMVPVSSVVPYKI